MRAHYLRAVVLTAVAILAVAPAQADLRHFGNGYVTAKVGNGCIGDGPNVGDAYQVTFRSGRDGNQPDVIYLQSSPGFARTIVPASGSSFGATGRISVTDASDAGSTNWKGPYRRFAIQALPSLGVAPTAVLSIDIPGRSSTAQTCWLTVKAALARAD